MRAVVRCQDEADELHLISVDTESGTLTTSAGLNGTEWCSFDALPKVFEVATKVA